MDNRERDIYARHVLNLGGLSECRGSRAALITGGERGVVVTSFAERVVPGKDFEKSPITDAILKYCKIYTRPDEGNSAIFTTYFPSLEEFLQIYLTDIRIVYHFGDVDDEKSVQFLNAHTKSDPEDGFQIIQLKI